METKKIKIYLFVSLIFILLILYVIELVDSLLATIQGETSDGTIWGMADGYSTAHDEVTDFQSNAELEVGQEFDGSDYYVYRAYLDFNTSELPDNAIITNVTLGMQIKTFFIDSNNFDVEIWDYVWTEPLSASGQDFNASEFGAIFDADWRNTLGLNTNTYYNSSDLNTSWINLTGETKYQLRSNRDVLRTEPTDAEYIDIYPSEIAGRKPTLYVTYTTECSPFFNQNWSISDKQVCDEVIRTTGTGSINILAGGSLHLINGANLTTEKLNLQTTGDQVFIGAGSELAIG